MTNPKEALEWHERRDEASIGITDELRKYASGCVGGMGGDALRHIADRIDEEYEKCIVDALLNDGLPMSDKVMAEYGWVRLPVDADGVPINVGDRLEEGEVGAVDTLELSRYGWIVFAGDTGMTPSVLHHHKPTVEDVLTELLETAVGYSDAHTTVALDAVAKYANRLKLKEDE